MGSTGLYPCSLLHSNKLLTLLFYLLRKKIFLLENLLSHFSPDSICMFKFFQVHFLKTAFFNPPLGDSHCFLFSVKPTMGVYQPTGYNENYMYLNMGMQTMPNGLVSSNELGTILLTVPPLPPSPPLLGTFVRVWVGSVFLLPLLYQKYKCY